MGTFFKSTPDGKGGFTTIEWKLGEWVGVNIVGFILMVAAAILFTTIIPIVMLLFYFVDKEEDRTSTNIIGILSSVYYLIDYHYGWIDRSFIQIFLSENFVNMFTYLQTSLILTHAVLLFFDKKIYFSEDNEEQRLPRLVLWVIAIIVGGYMLASVIVPHILPPLPIVE